MKKTFTYLSLIITAVVIFSSCAQRSGFQASESNYDGYKLEDGNYKKSKVLAVKPSVETIEELAQSNENNENETVTASLNDNYIPVTHEKELETASLKQNTKAQKTEVKSELKQKVTREEKKELRKSLKNLRKNPASEEAKTFRDRLKDKLTRGSDEDLLLIILCIILPPLAVYLFEGDITTNFWIDLVLTILGWLPGIVYAFVVIFA